MSINYYDYSTDVSGCHFQITRQPQSRFSVTLNAANSRTEVWRVIAGTQVGGYWASANRVKIALYQAGIAEGAAWTSASGDEIDEALRCTKLDIVQVSGKEWTVTGTFEIVVLASGSTSAESPLDLSPIVEYGTEIEDTPLWVDLSDPPKPVLNVNGSRFAQPLTYPYPYTVANVTRNELSFDAAYANLWKGKVNNALWNGYAAGYVLLRDVTGRQAFHPVIGTYWIVSYLFVFKPDIDKTLVLNAGYEVRKDASSPPKRALDDHGQPTAGDVLLAEDGTKLGDDDDPVFLEFVTALQVDFSDLNLEI